MKVDKYIHWNTTPNEAGEAKGVFDLLVGYCPNTLEYYRILASIMRETFPDAKDGELECFKVRKSIRVKGFTVLRLVRTMKKQDFEGWFTWHDLVPEYSVYS